MSSTLQDADADVKKYKKAVEASKAKWSEREAEEARLRLEIEELMKAINEAENQAKGCDEAFKGMLVENAKKKVWHAGMQHM